MTDSAIAEHIIYLVNAHNKQLTKYATHYKDYLMSLSSIKPICRPEKVLDSNLIDRIQATLENRKENNNE